MHLDHVATSRQADESAFARAVRWSIGVGLLALVVLPVYKLLDRPETGLAGRATIGLADIYYDFAWTGLLLLLPIAILAARLLTPETFDSLIARVSTTLLRPRHRHFMLGCATIGATLTAAFSLLVLAGKPNLTDAFTQLLQARYWADGMLAGPTNDLGAFWATQNAIFTEHGWVSQYPPGHMALLVPFLWLGTIWLFGPALVFVTIVSAGLLMDRLFPCEPAVVRCGVVLLAISPFFLFLSAALMNHVTAAACVTFGAYALLRAWSDDSRWAVAAGLALSLSLATRPLSTIAVALAMALLIPILWPRPVAHIIRTAAWGILGCVPILAAWFAYNAHFFGSAFRTGYSLAMGPSMTLGFHRDPWGNWYGPLEAIGYTSSDLVTLGISLFETPLSAVLIVGVFLVLARGLSRGTWFLLGLAIAPVLSNALYWHHGIFMGPRMLHEAAPAWIMLFTVSAVGLVQRIPPTATVARNYFLRPATAVSVLAAFAIGLFYMAPRRAISYGGSWIGVSRTPLPQTTRPSLIFVHDAWNARIAMTLAANGMRLDLVETLLRQNSTCRVHELAEAMDVDDAALADRRLAALDTVPRANRVVPERDGIRTRPGESLTRECRRQASSDRFGIIDISPLLWQADLHGASGDGVLVVRDLGPERNAAMLQLHPDREPFVYMQGPGFEGVRLLSYDEGMELLWSPPDDAGLL